MGASPGSASNVGSASSSSVLKSSPVQSFCLFGAQLDLDQSLNSQNLLQLQLQLIKTGNCSCLLQLQPVATSCLCNQFKTGNCSCNQLQSKLQLYYGLIMGLSNLLTELCVLFHIFSLSRYISLLTLTWCTFTYYFRQVSFPHTYSRTSIAT